ncbi:hypothetical protein COU56_05105 [Candidatus Pacearchaeota archaeon CG10_big_fil_rev_8_21_14_0_10_31_9]|nr:MAG: hypothetical protein AUJ62_04120 [Candidatus Pacearchaeota archaeon CG1_02_32_21]PIN91605.1 MAG: hypothetical protein COU56_05105 [Candidatus Pacearchaeota archaeon CG10_big_fil_rev_8_21_14_0_10_31_9]PIZ82656.1 MAG: hypothetical protein COX97_03725 [Candidatus Pacearchaeota archaeon CG_4_10_14_0_2_um_filter_05_32_18]
MAFAIQYFISWLLFWFIGWGGIYALPKMITDYRKNYFFVSAYFLFLSFLMAYYYKDIIYEIYKNISLFSIFLITILFAFNFLSYGLANKYLRKPTDTLLKHADIHFLHLDKRYLISKSFDILYQQILIIVLVFLLKNQGLNLIWISILFALIFGFGHIPAIRLNKSFFGTLIFLASIISSFLFPYLILTFKYGFIYTYMAHWLFYTNTGILFWVMETIRLKTPSKV